jgi:hypothetical protein
MATDLPYLNSYKNVGTLFTKIAAAKRPDVFNHAFLRDTLGLKSSQDRPLVAFLRTLGFIDAAGKPTADYDALKNPEKAAYAVGESVRRAYAPLFQANEGAHDLGSEQLRGLIAQVAGTDESMTKRIGYTLGALLKVAKFGTTPAPGQPGPEAPAAELETSTGGAGSLRPEFHYNIQIHLPSNDTEQTYISIFNAIRHVFR